MDLPRSGFLLAANFCYHDRVSCMIHSFTSDQNELNGVSIYMLSVVAVAGAKSVLGMEETLTSRPFFSSHEELMEEDYYDEQLPEKKRRLSPEQVTTQSFLSLLFANIK